MDTSVELTALTSDNDGSANVVPAVSDSAEDRPSSSISHNSSDIKLVENVKIISEGVSDNCALEGNVNSIFCIKSNVSCSSSLMACENNPAKSVEDNSITDSHRVDKDDSHVHLDHVSGRDTSTDDDGEIADSRSQTPLQDELEPDVDELSHNQVADTEVTACTDENQPHDCNAQTTNAECTELAECPSAAGQNSREENGEVSDGEDDEGIVQDQVTADSVSRKSPVDEEEVDKSQKQSQKVFICCLTTILHE